MKAAAQLGPGRLQVFGLHLPQCLKARFCPVAGDDTLLGQHYHVGLVELLEPSGE